MRVVIVKFALVAPAATVTLAGGVALVLLLESATTAPPPGAAPVRVTVPCELLPPVTLVGFSAREDKLAGGGGGGTGLTVSVAVRAVPLKEAEIVTLFVVLTVVVLMVKLAMLAPAATVTLAGVEATLGLLLDSVTTAPPLGAALLRVTVPCDVLPPTRLFGFRLSDESVGAAGAGCGVTRRVEENGPKTPAEFRARTRHQRRCAGKPLIVAWDAVTIWLATKGAEIVDELSI